MSTKNADTGEEQPVNESENDVDEWVEARREKLERLANSEHSSAWVAEKILQSDEEEGDS